jgi:hypothetical protein
MDHHIADFQMDANYRAFYPNNWSYNLLIQKMPHNEIHYHIYLENSGKKA